MNQNVHPREAERLAALDALRILDTEPIAELETAARMAATACGVPFGSINVISADRHFTAASFGAPPIHAARADSLCAMAILQGGTVYAPDAQVDPRFQGNAFLAIADPPIRLFAAAPINTDDGLPIGTVRIYGSEVKELERNQLEFLEDLAQYVMRFLQLRVSGLLLSEMAQKDDLTGLPNRRVLFGMFDAADSRAEEDVTLAYLDLNGFKEVNDTLGHAQGDLMLQAVAERLSAVVAEDELAVRLGGDEFLVRIPGRGRSAELLQRLRSAIDGPVDLGGESRTVRVAIGTAELSAGEEIAEGISRAEAEMYRDKAEQAEDA